MNFIETQFSTLNYSYPAEKETIKRLALLFDSAGAECYLNEILKRTEPSSNYALLSILFMLTERKQLKKMIILVNPLTGHPIQEFESLLDVPNKITINHENIEVDITVLPEHLSVLYRKII